MNKKGIKTKNKIKSTLLDLLNENELEEISVVLICKYSKVGRRTFYEHFNDKYEVVELLITDYIAGFKYSIDTLKVQNDFRTNLILGFKYLYENSNIFIMLYNSSLSRLFLKRIESLIKKLIREQINRSYLQQQNISEETILTFLSHAVIGIMIDIGLKRDIQYLGKVDEIMHIIIPYFKSQNN